MEGARRGNGGGTVGERWGKGGGAVPLRGPSSVPFWHITSIVNQQLLPGQALLAPDQFCDSLAHTILWGLRKRTPNARRSVGFRRWRARSSRGDRVIRCGFNPQQGVRN